jgi:hypothetical protein
MTRGVTRLMIASSTALAVIACAASAGAQGPPPPPDIPDIPDIPDLGEPDDKAKFRLIIEGSQYSYATVSGATQFGPCTYEMNLRNTETWDFARGKGVVLVFERFRRTVVMRRQGHPIGDTTAAFVGTVSRTAAGGYNEQGPPPCRGAFPSNQESCNTNHPVNSPMSLFWTGDGIGVDLPASQQLIPLDDSANPAHRCGIDDAQPDTAWFQYSYPSILKVQAGPFTKKQLFGKRKGLVATGEANFDQTTGGPYVNTEGTQSSLTVRLARLGKD